MVLGNCVGSDFAYEMCPGRDTGYHDVWCENWVPHVSVAFANEGKKRERGQQNVDMHGGESMYELTLTTTKDDPYELRQYLKKIVESRMFEIVYWEACMELTQAGIPHIHAVLYSKRKYLDGSKIKAPKGIAYPYRYEHKRVKMPQNYLNYIKKENGNPIIVDYCLKKGIPQFWDSNVQVQENVAVGPQAV